MTRDEANEYIQTNYPMLPMLTKARKGNYVCPFCGSGAHGDRDSDGALHYYRHTNTACCFGGCGRKKYDVFDIYEKVNGCDYNTALITMAGELGITIDGKGEATASAIPPLSAQEPAKEQTPGQDGSEEQRPNFVPYYRECMARIDDPRAEAYLASRGISLETARACNVGFDPVADVASHPGDMSGTKYYHSEPRIILPTSKEHFVGRAINPGATFAKLNPKGGHAGIFNARALYRDGVEAVVVTEGAFDALSVIEACVAAVALNSVANVDLLLEKLKKKPTKATLIIALDQDEHGKSGADALRAGLSEQGLSYINADICLGYKDPNEALVANRERFLQRVKVAADSIDRPDNTQLYIDTLMGDEIEKFKSNAKTGFPILDRTIGGLYGGLYVLAAISSLGKTSFALQLADQIAEGGNDVVYFSLEQSRLEMVSKSLAREVARLNIDTQVTSLSIRQSHVTDEVKQAATRYKKAVGSRMNIVEGNFRTKVSDIRDYVRNYEKRTGAKPVVFVDYLQILRPEEADKKQSVKETVDGAVEELKMLSRDDNLTVFVISSVNRANYLTPISFESLKESGGIEYSCDCLWGLQLQCLESDSFAGDGKTVEKRKIIEEAKDEDPRKIQLKCLKNRYGKAHFDCFYEYYPGHDLFFEMKEATVKSLKKPATKGRRA